VFFGHALPTENIRRPIKGSEDVHFRLVFLERKKLPLEFFSQAPRALSKNRLTPTTYDSTQKNLNPKICWI